MQNQPNGSSKDGNLTQSHVKPAVRVTMQTVNAMCTIGSITLLFAVAYFVTMVTPTFSSGQPIFAG